jgi:hypothetical protein
MLAPAATAGEQFARCHSACVCGVDGDPSDGEVHLRGQTRRFDAVGLPDTTARGGRDRFHSAILASGYHFPPGPRVVNLAPAGTRKSGAVYDLPVALAVLAAAGALRPSGSSRWTCSAWARCTRSTCAWTCCASTAAST